MAYHAYMYDQHVTKKSRKRRYGAGRKPRLAIMEDKLLFILFYFKVYPLHIGKNLSSLPDFSRTITAKEGFKAQLEAPYLPIPLGMSTLRMTSQICDR